MLTLASFGYRSFTAVLSASNWVKANQFIAHSSANTFKHQLLASEKQVSMSVHNVTFSSIEYCLRPSLDWSQAILIASRNSGSTKHRCVCDVPHP